MSLKNRYFFACISIMVFITIVGCGTEDGIFCVTMKDGRIIEIDSRIRDYPSEEQFVHSVSFPNESKYNIDNIDSIDYTLGSSYEVYGYDEILTTEWENVKLGEWATNYGLSSSETYYAATNIYRKYLTPVPSGMFISPLNDNEEMGYIPGVIPKTFIVTKDNGTSICVLQTCEKCIMYDANGNLINISINNLKTKLTWKFLTLEDFWD